MTLRMARKLQDALPRFYFPETALAMVMHEFLRAFLLWMAIRSMHRHDWVRQRM